MRRTTGTVFGLACFLCLCQVTPLCAATITIDANQVLGSVNPLIYGNAQPFGHGDFLLRPGSTSFEPQALNLVSALRPTVLRFPGGTHADEYLWEDGIGPLQLRPAPRLGQYESFGFAYGTDEHMALCEAIGAQAFITVNYSSGLVRGSLSTSVALAQRIGRAADWVEYCNAPHDGFNPNGGVEWAARRAANGHPEPYEVKFWEIGNEIYGNTEASHTDVETYANDLIAFSRAMKAVDPDVKIGAVGSMMPHWSSPWNDSSQEWNATLLQIAHQDIDFLVVHAHYPGSWNLPTNAEDLYRAGLAGAHQALAHLVEIRGIIDQAADSSVVIVPGENGFYAGGGRNYQLITSLLAGLHYADLLMLFLQQSSALNIRFACGWILHSSTYAGDIAYQWSPERRYARPEYCAHQIFREHFGDVLVANSVDCGIFETVEAAKVQAMADVPELSACTTLDSAGARLFLMVVNRQLDEDVDAHIELTNFEPQPEARTWTLNGPHITANNEDDPNTVTIVPATLAPVSASFTYTFPAHSLTAIELNRAVVTSSGAMPSNYKLWQNYPNPFNGGTNIRYHLPRGGAAALRIYNSLGQLVKTLAEEHHRPGEHQLFWDATDELGEEVASGVYFCTLQADDFRKTCKMILLR
jgi:alpha-N-arabinofuranosidase